MRQDIIIGFEEKPESLDGFLKKQGYTHVDSGEKTSQTFEHTERDLVVSYSPEILKESEPVPDWKELGFEVVSELGIDFYRSEFEEANRLAEEIVKQFNGIMYDPDLDGVFRKDSFVKGE